MPPQRVIHCELIRMSVLFEGLHPPEPRNLGLPVLELFSDPEELHLMQCGVSGVLLLSQTFYPAARSFPGIVSAQPFAIIPFVRHLVLMAISIVIVLA